MFNNTLKDLLTAELTTIVNAGKNELYTVDQIKVLLSPELTGLIRQDIELSFPTKFTEHLANVDRDPLTSKLEDQFTKDLVAHLNTGLAQTLSDSTVQYIASKLQVLVKEILTELLTQKLHALLNKPGLFDQNDIENMIHYIKAGADTNSLRLSNVSCYELFLDAFPRLQFTNLALTITLFHKFLDHKANVYAVGKPNAYTTLKLAVLLSDEKVLNLLVTNYPQMIAKSNLEEKTQLLNDAFNPIVKEPSTFLKNLLTILQKTQLDFTEHHQSIKNIRFWSFITKDTPENQKIMEQIIWKLLNEHNLEVNFQDTDHRDRKGDTLLHSLARAELFTLIRTLIEKNEADPKRKNYEGQTPLDLISDWINKNNPEHGKMNAAKSAEIIIKLNGSPMLRDDFANPGCIPFKINFVEFLGRQLSQLFQIENSRPEEREYELGLITKGNTPLLKEPRLD